MPPAPRKPRLRPFVVAPHFLGFAPLDVWARILAGGRWRVHPAYLPRLLLICATSLIATLVTLPERLVLAPWLRWRFRDGHASGSGEVVVVTGYYRSGTTHLHYLLSADRRFTTPRWAQVSAGQGFKISWAILRFAMVPFTPNKRTQDDVPFGPDWPAEDDFALCTWANASAIPWRYVFPSRGDLDDEWNFLVGLDERQTARFRRTLAAFVWKLTCLRPNRRVLLKTPSHTARLSELKRVFGDRLRVIHITRDPEPVIRSNLRMMRRLEAFGLERALQMSELRPRVVSQYVRTEEAFLSACERETDVPVARVRFQDLVADPIGQMRAAYDSLGLAWTGDGEERMAAYLRGVAGHRVAPESKPEDLGNPTDEERDACARLRGLFGHATPSVDAVPLPAGGGARARPTLAGWIAAPVASAVCLGAWLMFAALLSNRLDTFVWVWGFVIGVTSAFAGGRGSAWLGLWAAFWFLAMIAASIYPLPDLAHGWDGVHRWRNVRTAYGSVNGNYLWIVLGLLTAWRCGSRRLVRAPGG